MRTEDAVTGASGVSITLAGVVVLYTLLGTATVLVLRAMSRRWREADSAEVEIPYGPRPPAPEAVESA
jgi:cytochrome d ubiquinol oxidase subunit I